MCARCLRIAAFPRTEGKSRKEQFVSAHDGVPKAPEVDKSEISLLPSSLSCLFTQRAEESRESKSGTC